MSDWPPKGIDWYYADEWSAIALGDCRTVLPLLPKVGLILTDPPYGINLASDYRATRQVSHLKHVRAGRRHAWPSRSHDPIKGDSEPFDPSFLLSFPRLILWGANAYSERLPSSYSWFVWDKKDGRGAANGFSDAELAWVYGGGFQSVRVFRHLWTGYQRDSEVGERVLHPTQKPVALMKWCLSFFPELSVVDPYMGAGSTLRAAKDLGRKAIGIELEEKYCEIAALRLSQQVLKFEEDEKQRESIQGSLLAEVASR